MRAREIKLWACSDCNLIFWSDADLRNFGFRDNLCPECKHPLYKINGTLTMDDGGEK